MAGRARVDLHPRNLVLLPRRLLDVCKLGEIMRMSVELDQVDYGIAPLQMTRKMRTIRLQYVFLSQLRMWRTSL